MCRSIGVAGGLVAVALCFNVSAADVTWEAIQAAGEGYESSVATARITAWVTRSKSEDPLEFNSESVREQVDQVAFDHANQQPRERLLALLGRLNPDVMQRYENRAPGTVWRIVSQETLIYDGDQERSTSEGHDFLRTQGLHLVKQFANKFPPTATRVEAQGNLSPKLGYNTLWSYLPRIRKGAFDETAEIRETETGIEIRSVNGTRAIVDREHYLPILVEYRLAADGPVTALMYYRNYVLFPGAVLLPTEQYQFDFTNDGQLEGHSIKLLESAELNQEIDAGEFVMSTEAGTIVTDNRFDPTSRSLTLEQPLPDVTEYFLAKTAETDDGDRVQEPKSSGRGLNWKSFFLIINGIVLMSLGLYLWRRQV